jgi:hypothetical protein
LASLVTLPAERQDKGVATALAMDIWEALVFSRLAAVASHGSLGYALAQSRDTDSWLDDIVAALVGQSNHNKSTALRRQGIYPVDTYLDANRLSKTVREQGKGKPKRTNDPNKAKETREAKNKVKMEYIQEHAFPLPKLKKGRKKTASASRGSDSGGAETEEERLLTHLYHYRTTSRVRKTGREIDED